jgi:hypothetical protein
VSFNRKLWLLIAAGTGIRLVVSFTTTGVLFDIDSYEQVLNGWRAHHFHFYETTATAQWPYPPGYLPWVLVAGKLVHFFDFGNVIRWGAIIADAGLVWLVQDLLRRAGADENRRLLGAALIALGPVSIGVAGFNGQVDPAATLPAVAAYWVWTRPGQRHRGWGAGALIGLAGSLKTVPLFLAWPVACDAKTPREGASVLAGAAVVFLVILAPFALASHAAIDNITGYQGVPGWGGLSLLIEPRWAANLLHHQVGGNESLILDLKTNGKYVLMPAIGVMSLFLVWRRPDALTGICLMYLTIYVFGVSFFISYLVWALPFLVVRGHFKAVAALQLGLAPAQIAVFIYDLPLWVAYLVYTLSLAVVWFAFAGALGRFLIQERLLQRRGLVDGYHE